ncbi:hypothetical protein CDAR_101031 [Caerostris darwini]|uniref:Uncharacterized protein n=1 Tax=Caerostris darwini TaxID=1538125 RepID=A0AAV4NAM5_9ARAC|nr:hypothetical protein CDAR_101031 [Caerostris darwini]
MPGLQSIAIPFWERSTRNLQDQTIRFHAYFNIIKAYLNTIVYIGSNHYSLRLDNAWFTKVWFIRSGAIGCKPKRPQTSLYAYVKTILNLNVHPPPGSIEPGGALA